MVDKEQEQRLIEAEDEETESRERDPKAPPSGDWERRHAREIGELIRRCYETQQAKLLDEREKTESRR